MPQQRASLFLHLNSKPNPEAHQKLWEHRLRQRRPISRNPFVTDEPAPPALYERAGVDSPGPSRQPTYEDNQQSHTSKFNSKEEIRSNNPNLDIEWGDQAPGWLNLFYDLAWTATFSSLTSNNKFKQPWDSISYIVFFTIAWWMWTSQVFYSIDYYTDDWFHLLIVFLQLIIFGALAATTRGFDVSTYILHSPGSNEWEDTSIENIKPEQYANERVAKVSLVAISIVFALSRLLLLVQHIRVVIYAKFTHRSRRYPIRLLLVPVALAISTTLFFISFVVTKRHGTEANGAKVKFYLWGSGILVEVIAHIIRFQWEINDGIKLRSHGSIAGRLCDITTIIMGEGINAIAGTFFAIQKAPGFGGPTGAGIVCCALIVFFLTYLYFEGAAPLESVRRRAAWAMVHLPWLLSAILLLEGVKNQLLLSSFLNSFLYLSRKTEEILNLDGMSDEKFEEALRPILLKVGLSFKDQWQRLEDLLQANMTGTNATELDGQTVIEITTVWYLRMQMSSIVNTYITFMDNDTIADDVQKTFSRYQNDYAFTFQDLDNVSTLQGVIWDLIHASVNNARYISGLCGMTFICLATLNLIQSWPRDRFHWASIISRYLMGFCMLMLLLLNIGKYQTFFPEPGPNGEDRSNEAAGVLKWIHGNWVLPTLALAYGIQFIVDTALVYIAVWYTRKSNPNLKQSEKAQ